ncbi:MAG: Txe/YoeB family addiction module toxin [Ginsengibacter sp.]
MEVEYSDRAEEDAREWIKSGNIKIQNKITRLIENILETPFQGIGKPEPLKHNLTGKWSRRITSADRLIYEISENTLYIYSLKGHY